MAQVKIYALRKCLDAGKSKISDTIHQCMMENLQLPEAKRFHRFLELEKEDFIYPADRSENYIILEISMFEGRSTETKKALIHSLFQRFEETLSCDPNDLEITITETPRHNWGIRGTPGDELILNYKVEQ